MQPCIKCFQWKVQYKYISKKPAVLWRMRIIKIIYLKYCTHTLYILKTILAKVAAGAFKK